MSAKTADSFLSVVPSSSSISSSSVQYRDLTSSRDNDPSSETASVDKQLRLYELNMRPSPPLTTRKSSDDDDACELKARYFRTRKANGRRSLIKRKLVNSTSSVNCNSSPYPSSTASSGKESSSSESLSPDGNEEDRCMITLGGLSNDIANHALERNIECSDIKQSEEIKWALGKIKSSEHKDGLGTTGGTSSYEGSNGYNFPPIIPEEFKIIFNVSGKIFEFDQRQLDRYPNTMLGDHNSRMEHYDWRRKEYFFDRHRDVFEAALDFYSNSGTLIRPDHIPIDIFVNEIRFYAFDYKTLEDFLRDEGLLLTVKSKPMPTGKFKRTVWQLFEDPESSWCSKVITIVSALVITVSVVVFCLETLPAFLSLSHNVTEAIQPSVNACQHSINNPRLNGGNRTLQPTAQTRFKPNSHETRIEGNILDYKLDALVRIVKSTLEKCVDSPDLPVLYRYTAARCLIEVDDERKQLEQSLSHLKLIRNIPNKSEESNLRHKRQRKTERDAERSIVNLINTRETHANQTGFKLNQSLPDILAGLLIRTCKQLDENSTRSPYAWFVLEAKMGSPAGILFLTETSCIVWFVLELGLRFLTCPDRKAFCKSFLNIVDASAILPYFITLIVTSIEIKTHLRPQTATILRTIRLVRMLRILKLSRYSRGFRILGLTLVRSTRVLFLLVCFQMVLAILFSSIVYFVEYDAPGTQFKSIPDSFWWALITMTTVGYGDVVPITVFGKIAGAGCAIMGILCISFPVPVIVSNFNYLYNLDKDDCKLVPEDIMGDNHVFEQKDFKTVDKFQ
ncbi:potassium voltage-gated channel subfamily A member 3-like isoform X1 [Ciona intestinalis]